MKDHGIYKYSRISAPYYQYDEFRFLDFDDFFLPYEELMRTTQKAEFFEDPEWQSLDFNPFLTPNVKRFPLYVMPGIDLIKFNFKLDKIDWTKFNPYFEQKIGEKYGYKIHIQDTEVEEKQLAIKGNKKYQSIIISSDKFRIAMKKTIFGKNTGPDSMIIELHVDSYWEGAGNIENRSYVDTDLSLKSYIEKMETYFGIFVRYESISINYVEVNMTFDPMGDTSELIRLLSPFQTFLPKSFELNDDYKYKSRMESDYVKNKPLKIMKYNGMRVKSRTIDIKIYNKKYEHNHQIDEKKKKEERLRKKALKEGSKKKPKDESANSMRKISTELIRIEFAVWKPKQVKSHFGTNIWHELTDKGIKDAFYDMYKCYIEKNYEEYICRGRSEMINYFKTIDITDRSWRKKLQAYSEGFYRKSGGGFFVFSRDDIKIFVDQINAPSVKSNKSRICKSIEDILLPKDSKHTRERWVYLVGCLIDCSRRLQEGETLQYMVEFET